MEASTHSDVERLLRQQAALAEFGTFAFREPGLHEVLTEASRICAASLDVPLAKICRYRPEENDLLVEAGWGWQAGVIGHVVSQADETSPQGRAYTVGRPVIIRNIHEADDLNLPSFYARHGVVSTVNVLIPGKDGPPYGVLEIDGVEEHEYDAHDISFLTCFANVLAEAVATTKRVRALRELVEQKDMLAEELQHRVRNNLQLVNSMLVSHARTAKDVPMRRGIDMIVRRVTTLAKIHDHLLGSGLSRTIDFGPYLEALCATLPELQDDAARTIELVCRTSPLPLPLDLDAVTALGMAVAELVTNSYGHAFPDRVGTIEVKLASLVAGGARLTISDDGVGFEAGAENKRRGLGLVRRLAQQAGAAIDLRSGHGTTWTLTLPAAREAGAVQRAA